MSTVTHTTTVGSEMSGYIYGINIGQFLIGAVITALNLVLWLSVAVNYSLRTAPNCFLGNIWFGNLLLGIIVTVSNVVDDSNTYVFKKTEGTVAIVNGFITVAMLLALVANRVVKVRNPSRTMSTMTAFKIIIVTWVVVLCLTLIKAIIFGLNQIGISGACFDCFLIFEVTTLVFATAATLFVYFGSLYLIYVHRNRTVGDSASRGPGATAINHEKEYETTLTIGLLILGFSLTFLSFVSLIAVWLAEPHLLNAGVAEIIITLFYTHCLINPVVVLIRDADTRNTVRSLMRCQRPNVVAGPQETPRAAGQTGNGFGEPQVHGLTTSDSRRGQRAQNIVSTNPFEIPSVDTPASQGQRSTPPEDNGGNPRYGSIETAVVHEIPPPTGGVAFMTG